MKIYNLCPENQHDCNRQNISEDSCGFFRKQIGYEAEEKSGGNGKEYRINKGNIAEFGYMKDCFHKNKGGNKINGGKYKAVNFSFFVYALF